MSFTVDPRPRNRAVQSGPESMYHKFSRTCRSLDTLVPNKPKGPQDRDEKSVNLESDEQPADHVDYASLPPKPKAARLRRQSAVYSLMRRAHSSDFLNRVSAHLTTSRPPLISTPFNFAHMQPSGMLSSSPTLGQSDYLEEHPSIGPALQPYKAEQDDSAASSPVWVAVDCARCNEVHPPKSLACQKTIIPAWPYDHPHPLRSNPLEHSRSSSLPSAFDDGQPWQNRHVSFRTKDFKS